MITDREVREAILKLKQYCLEHNCKNCQFENNCIDGMYPCDWRIEPETPSDMERSFARKAIERCYDIVNIDYDADGRHVFIYDAKNPGRYEFLRADSFPSLYNAGDYSLRDMIGDNE